MDDPRDLERFVRAQAPVFDQAMRELVAGSKRTHWMWFVFPQLRGLGRSQAAHLYGLDGAAEARAFLRHATLGPRLVACTRQANVHAPGSALRLFGSPDDLKFRSCMTLFASIETASGCFADALRLYFYGARDPATLALLRSPP